MSRRSKLKARGKRVSPASSTSAAGRGGGLFPPAAQSHNHWLSFAVCLLLALAVWFVFGQTLRHGFVSYDDNVYVYDNPAVARGLSWNGVVWAFTHSQSVTWHPLTTLTHMLDCQLYGLHPGGHHLTNVLLHTATAILLFLTLRNMTGAFWPAAFVAGVFAIHPLRVESVAWVAERKDVLSGLFFMLTIWAYVQYVRNSCRLWSYLMVLVLYALGLMSKPMLVTMPFILLLLDYWPLQRMPGFELGVLSSLSRDRQNVRRLVREKVPFLLLAAGVSVITVLAQRKAMLPVQALSFPSRIENAFVAYATYIWQMLYPVGLAVFYPHPGNGLSAWEIGLSVLALIVISTGVVVGWRKHPYLLVGWLWYVGMLVPVTGLIQVGAQARADRYTYLPEIGLYILVAWGTVDLCRNWRHRRTLLGVAAAAILAGLLTYACLQTSYWKDSVTLWRHALACTADNATAESGLGLALADQGELTEAIQHYERALQLNPDYIDAHNNLGSALVAQGRLPEAIKHFERAIQLDTDYGKAQNNLGNALVAQGRPTEAVGHLVRALRLNPDDAEVCYNLGNALVAQGNLTEAVKRYEHALQLNPDYAGAHYNLGNALAGQGKLPEAIEHYERALQLNPDDADIHNNLGNALMAQGRLTDAIRHFERALQLKPDDARVHFNLGSALARQGKSAEAVEHYERALRLNPNDASVHNNLGLALIDQGKLTEAIEHFQQALQCDPNFIEAHFNLGNALAKEGRLNDAMKHFQQALALAKARGDTALAETIRARLKSYPPALLSPPP